jgi:hypothetical protein
MARALSMVALILPRLRMIEASATSRSTSRSGHRRDLSDIEASERGPERWSRW